MGSAISTHRDRPGRCPVIIPPRTEYSDGSPWAPHHVYDLTQFIKSTWNKDKGKSFKDRFTELVIKWLVFRRTAILHDVRCATSGTLHVSTPTFHTETFFSCFHIISRPPIRFLNTVFWTQHDVQCQIGRTKLV